MSNKGFHVLAVSGVVGALAAFAPPAHGGDCGSARTLSHESAKPDIVDTAVAAGSFNTLVAAVEAAGLADTLKSEGPFTVFAPTDEAFARVPEKTLSALLADPESLKAVLLYHVVPGKVMASDVVKLTSAKTALGQTLSISTSGGVRVGSANVVQTDIETSNGVIHVIDTVLLPKKDIIEVARSAGSFSTLLAAIDAAGLTDALRSDGPFTVFAPTDAAFGKLPEGTIEALLNDRQKLTSILTYHVVPGKVLAADVVKLSEAETLQGQSVTVSTSSSVMVDNAHVTKTDIMATNGVIHVIDTVILPD
jgi:transforming growth factor-beta-induced protein